MKRTIILSALLTLLTLMLCADAMAATTIDSGECGENVTWKLDSEGMLTIKGEGEMDDYSWGEAPWYFNSSNIISLTIEDGICSIGRYAFNGCINLTSINILKSKL